MRVYVAGKFEKKEEILEAYEKLKKLGFEIAYDWTTHKPIKPYEENQKMANIYSTNELNGIANTDVFIYLASDKGHTLHMEFGAALIQNYLGKKVLVYAVGQHNNKSPWFFNEHVIRKDTLEEVIEDLKRLKGMDLDCNNR